MISLIICTYKRPKSIENLLNSIQKCTIKPTTILIIDASPDTRTQDLIHHLDLSEINVNYYTVNDEHRGLTRQRNYGISKLPGNSEIVAFLDDDVTVDPDYFEKLIETYSIYPDAIGVGGIDLKDNGYCRKQVGVNYNRFHFYELDGWVVRESLRNKARKIFGLMPDLQPGLIPEYSNGRSTFPPNGKTYLVEHFMGGIASYRKQLFDHIKFSRYFEGYGLYEDFDFCVRALPYGKLYVNSNAKIWHHHEPSGRPDFLKYGKMVVRNGWYVWRVHYPSPSLKSKLKWHAITLLLANIRLANSITGPDKKNAFMDYLGRMIAWASVLINPPSINYKPD